MWVLVSGLMIFLGVHSIRIFGERWRAEFIALRGEGSWKGGYSLLSALGLGLVIWGFGLARQQPVLVWSPPAGLKHLAMALTAVSFILLAAAYVPGNQIKARVHHPMVLGVKVWALAHLLANGLLSHVVLFGAFLVWAVLDFSSARRRDRQSGVSYRPGGTRMTAFTVVLGLLVWTIFAAFLHGWLIGVRPWG